MKLSDVMSGAGLSIYAEIAMVIFMAVFIGIVIHLFRPSRRESLERHGAIPLDEGRTDKTQTGGRP